MLYDAGARARARERHAARSTWGLRLSERVCAVRRARALGATVRVAGR